MEIRHTICRLCSSCCPVEVRVANGRLVRAERRSFLPPEKRAACPKLDAAPEIVYSPGRLSHPVIRKGRKTGGFTNIPWDEALGIMADRFEYFRAHHGPQSVCWLRGMAADWGASWDYANRLMNAFGSPNTIGNGSVCHVARDMAHTYTCGAMTSADIRNAGCVLIWGKNDRHTNPPAYERIAQARARGAVLIVIDPVRTELASLADIWLQVKPGHDGLLAMGMIHEIISAGLYDRDFVREWTVGFEALRTAARAFRIDDIAEGIWLDPSLLRDAAHLYATAGAACIIDGNGLDMQRDVFQTTRAVSILRALTGNIDRPGGDLLPRPVPTRNIQLRERLPAGVEPVTRAYPLFNAFHETWGLHVQSAVIDAIVDETPYPVKMLVVQSANPAVTMTDSHRVEAALRKLEFMVVIDPFMTRTAEFADMVLPAAVCFEETRLNRAYMRDRRVMIQNRVIDSVGDSRPDWRIVFDLARRLGLEEAFPWESVEEAIDHQLAPSGITVAVLRENPDGLRFEKRRYEKYKTDGFGTPSGKVEFYSDRLKRNGFLPVPYQDGGHRNPISFSGRSGEFPLIGISGARTSPFTHTQFHRIPALVSREPEGFVDIHPRDAEARGIEGGDRVHIRTPRGRIRMKARLSRRVHPGSVRIAWGRGEIDPEQGVNRLTEDAERDEITGTPSNRSFMCEVAPEDRFAGSGILAGTDPLP